MNFGSVLIHLLEEGTIISAFVHGLILSLGLVVQPGPQSLLILAQGIAQPRFVQVLPAVVGVALADTLLILCAVNGASTLLMAWPWAKAVLLVVGIAFLSYVGWSTWRKQEFAVSQPGEDAVRVVPHRQLLLGLSLTLFNPGAFLDIFGLIGTASLKYGEVDKVVFVLACVLVSWIWFALLAIAAQLVRSLQSQGRWLNRGAALLLWANALYLLYSVEIG